jgi:hypothetical protein
MHTYIHRYVYTYIYIHYAQWAKGPAYSLAALSQARSKDATSTNTTLTPSVPNPFLVKKEEETFKRTINPFGLVQNPMLGHEPNASLDNPCPTLEMMQLSAEYPQGNLNPEP